MAGQLGLFSTLFDNLPVGLIVLDERGRVVIYNRMEAQLAGRERDRVIGREFFVDIAPCMNVKQLGGEFSAKIGRSALDLEVEMSFPFPHHERPRDVKVRLSSFEVEQQSYGFLLVEDISLRRSVDRMREQLQSLLVHDLKNPLTAVSMNLQLLEETPSVRDAPDALDLITQALDATRRLGRMTVDLLDISRLETASMPLRRTSVDMRNVFERVRADNHTSATLNGAVIDVDVHLAASPSLDEDLIVRALDNLVENAVRNAKHVVLRARNESGALLVEVQDDGPGVPEALRAKLFDKYVQVSTPGQARGQNRGLGLTFVRLVAQQHGGDVELECPPGKGSIFTLRFPLGAT